MLWFVSVSPSVPRATLISLECQILGLGDGKVMRIYGLDAFQALQLGLRFVSTLLHHHRREAKGGIYWLEPGDDMGFEVRLED